LKVLLGIGLTAAAMSAAAISALPDAQADSCINYAVMRGQPGQDDYYWCLGGGWHHVVPYFDPNSADGYGPTQLVPPLCVRFPDQYDCATERFQPPGY
jgi:hypothetical protein